MSLPFVTVSDLGEDYELRPIVLVNNYSTGYSIEFDEPAHRVPWMYARTVEVRMPAERAGEYIQFEAGVSSSHNIDSEFEVGVTRPIHVEVFEL